MRVETEDLWAEKGPAQYGWSAETPGVPPFILQTKLSATAQDWLCLFSTLP